MVSIRMNRPDADQSRGEAATGPKLYSASRTFVLMLTTELCQCFSLQPRSPGPATAVDRPMGLMHLLVHWTFTTLTAAHSVLFFYWWPGRTERGQKSSRAPLCPGPGHQARLSSPDGGPVEESPNYKLIKRPQPLSGCPITRLN